MPVHQPLSVVSEAFRNGNLLCKVHSSVSDVSQPLRDLTKKDAQFEWTDEHEIAFRRIIELLTSDTVMAYFDQTKETELVTDASPWGLSAILTIT